MTATVEQRVCDALYDACPGNVVEILPRMSLKVDLEFDDLNMIEALIELEDEFDIDIDDTEWDKVLTVGDVVALVTVKVEP